MTTDVPTISAQEALRRAADGAVLLDVREPAEWQAGHAPRAVHVPLAQLPATRLPDWSARTVLVICRSGHRSQFAAALLHGRGLDAYSVDGGMRDWQALGGAVVTAAGTPGRVV